MRGKLIISLFLGLMSSCLFGQQIPVNNQYHINPFSLSPAFAGHNNNFEMFLNYRNSWGGIDGAPEVSNININSKLMKNMGLGGSITNDKIGIFRNLNVSLAYSYAYKLAANKILRFGLSAGIYESYIDVGPQSDAANQDPVLLANADAINTLFDVSFGVNYKHKSWNIGLVVPQLLENTVKGEDNGTSIYSLSRHYLSYINYSYIINRDVTLNPTAIIRTSANSPLSYEVGALLRYKKIMWFSSSFRKNETVVFSIGGLPYERIAFNYSYEIGGEIGSSSNGTHEITIGIQLGTKKNTTTSIFNITNRSKKSPYINWENGRLKL